MATSKIQRIGIWVIAIALLMGTLGSFLAMGLMTTNQKIDQAQQQKAYDEYLAQQELDQQAAAYASEGFGGYSSQIFDASLAKDLKVEILVDGSGAIVSKEDSINCSYFGWLPDGVIFDSSKKKNVDDAPITFSLGQVIDGWTEGLAGQKVGSVVRLTIPSEKAYGSQSSGLIPADSPLQFIVEIHSIDNGVEA